MAHKQHSNVCLNKHALKCIWNSVCKFTSQSDSNGKAWLLNLVHVHAVMVTVMLTSRVRTISVSGIGIDEILAHNSQSQGQHFVPQAKAKTKAEA